jgi:hypothetical protein
LTGGYAPRFQAVAAYRLGNPKKELDVTTDGLRVVVELPAIEEESGDR